MASTLLALLTALPGLIQAGENVIPLINAAQAALASGADPTDAQWQAIDNELAALTMQLNKDP